MPQIEQDVAMAFAREWVDSWNRHDMDSVLDHYTLDFEFCSPVITQLTGEASGCLRGREAIGRYWESALAKHPELHFKLLDVLAGIDSVTLYYQGHRGRVAESFHFNKTGKAIKSMACYSVLPSNVTESHDE